MCLNHMFDNGTSKLIFIFYEFNLGELVYDFLISQTGLGRYGVEESVEKSDVT